MRGIYSITNTVNGKVYVGQTEDIERRWKQHRHLLNRGKHSNSHLQRSWRKYGWSSFRFRTIEEIPSPAPLTEAEARWIKDLHAKDRRRGYNTADPVDGMTGFKHSDESKARMSKLAKGRKISPETRAKMSKALKGKSWTAKHRERAVESRRKNGTLGRPKGYKHSEETKAKIAEAHRGMKHSEEAKAKMSAAKRGKPRAPRKIC